MQPQTNTRYTYSSSGHAKKLLPIIESLDRYDHDPNSWQDVKDRVTELTQTFDHLLHSVQANTREREALHTLRDLCFDTIRVQAEIFHQHRHVCVDALRLKKLSLPPPPTTPQPTPQLGKPLWQS